MKLILTKDQSKGLMGGVSFEVKAQVQLTEEEKKLIQHYKLEKEILLQKRLIIWGQPTDHLIDVSVMNLLSGESYKCKSLEEVISYSDSLKEACKTLKIYLEIAKSFGGQEVIEI